MALPHQPQFSGAGAQTASAQTAGGCTDFPTVKLSFKWVINHARPVLALHNVNNLFKSPLFKTAQPRSSMWYLLLNAPCSDWLSVFLTSSTEDALGVKLGGSSPKCCVTNCTFSVMDAKTNEKKYSKDAPSAVCDLPQQSCYLGEFIKKNQLQRLLSDDVLAIQVDASIIYKQTIHTTYTATSPIPPHNALDGVKRLYEEKRFAVFADIVIKCGEKDFNAHKAILSSQSPVFNRMFTTDMKERKSDIVEISDINHPVMSDLLAYFYTGNAPNLHTLAKDLLYAASKYELPRLEALCENELMVSLSLNNLLEVVQCASMYNLSNLKMACLNMIKCNSAKIFKSESWITFKRYSNKELVYEILEFKT